MSEFKVDNSTLAISLCGYMLVQRDDGLYAVAIAAGGVDSAPWESVKEMAADLGRVARPNPKALTRNHLSRIAAAADLLAARQKDQDDAPVPVPVEDET